VAHEKFTSVNTFPVFVRLERCNHADNYNPVRRPICGCQDCADKYILHIADRLLHGEVGEDMMLVKRLAANIIETIEGKKK
jgi:hypothetical protein